MKDRISWQKMAADSGPSSGQKEVIVVFKDRRRPIVFKCSTDPVEEHQHILEAVIEVFADVLSSGEG